MKEIKVTKLPESEVLLEGEISLDLVNKHRSEAIKSLSGNLEIKGFRKGHIPEEIAVKNLGDMAVLEKTAELALAEIYPEMVKEFKLNIIDRPKIKLTKLAPENPIGFSLTVAVMPEVKLPDYKKIAEETKREDPSSVTADEIEKSIGEVRKQFAQIRSADKNNPPKEIPESEWPELTDDMVKGLGPYDSVASFRKHVEKYLEEDKKNKASEKNRVEILEKVLSETQAEIPKPLTEYELEKMVFHFKNDLDRAGLALEKYLSEIKKTEAELQAQWRPAAEKRAKLQLIISKIAEKEDIKIDPKKLEDETKHVLSHHKEADPERVKALVSLDLQNDAVISFLEKVQTKDLGSSK